MPTAAQIWQLAQDGSILAVVLVALISGFAWLGLAWIRQRADYRRSLNEGRDRETAQYEAETARLKAEAERQARLRELEIKARELEIFARFAELGLVWRDTIPAEASATLPLKSAPRIASPADKGGQKAA